MKKAIEDFGIYLIIQVIVGCQKRMMSNQCILKKMLLMSDVFK